jgi:hypothetical protein
MDTKPTDWFSSLLDVYEKHGQGWRNYEHAKLATEYFAYFLQTGEQKYLDACDKYLLSALPDRGVYENETSGSTKG